MDPVSILNIVQPLVPLVSTVSRSIIRFQRRFRHAEAEIRKISLEIELWQPLLQTLRTKSVPADLVITIKGEIQRCEDVLRNIQNLLESHSPEWRDAARWAAQGHKQTNKLLQDLEQRRRCLNHAVTTNTLLAVMTTSSDVRTIQTQNTRIENRLNGIGDDLTLIREALAAVPQLQALREGMLDRIESNPQMVQPVKAWVSERKKLSESVHDQASHEFLDDLLEATSRVCSPGYLAVSPEGSLLAQVDSSRRRNRYVASGHRDLTSPDTTTTIMEEEVTSRETPFSPVQSSIGTGAAYNLKQITKDTPSSAVTSFTEHGGNPNTILYPPDDTPRPALHQAILAENNPCMVALLQAGADPNLVFGAHSPLRVAIRAGNSDAVEVLLQNGAQQERLSLLDEAVIYGDARMVRLLLRHGNVATQETLRRAITGGKQGIVKLLIESGVRPDESSVKDAIESGSPTILDVVFQKCASFGGQFRAIMNSCLRWIFSRFMSCISRAASISSIRTAVSMLRIAFRHTDLSETSRIAAQHNFLQRAISINVQRRNRKAIEEAGNARKEVCEIILHSGVDTNIRGQCEKEITGHAPLICVLTHQVDIYRDGSCILEMARILLANGARLVFEDPRRDMILIAAEQGLRGVTELFIGSPNYQPENHATILDVLRVTIDRRWEGATTRLLTGLKGHTATGKEVIKANGEPLLCSAVTWNKTEVIEGLISNGFKPNKIVVESAIDNGRTQTFMQIFAAFHKGRRFRAEGAETLTQAVEKGNEAIIKALLDEKVRPDHGTFVAMVKRGTVDGLMRKLERNGITGIERGDEIQSLVNDSLRTAVETRNRAMIDYVWEFGQRHRATKWDPSILTDAIRENDAEITSSLLEDKFSFQPQLIRHATDVDMMSLLWHYAARDTKWSLGGSDTLLQQTVRYADPSVVNSMLDAARAREQSGVWGYRSLKFAATTTLDIPQPVIHTLWTHQLNLEGALLFAAETRDWHRVQELHNSGADIDYGIAELARIGSDSASSSRPVSISMEGFPVLYHAIFQANLKQVKSLVNSGADTNRRFRTRHIVRLEISTIGSDEWTPLYMATACYIEFHREGARYLSRAESDSRQRSMLDIVDYLVRMGAADLPLRTMTLQKGAGSGEEVLTALELAFRFCGGWFSSGWLFGFFEEPVLRVLRAPRKGAKRPAGPPRERDPATRRPQRANRQRHSQKLERPHSSEGKLKRGRPLSRTRTRGY